MNTQKTILALAVAAVAALPAFGAIGTYGPFTGYYPGTPTDTTTQNLSWPKSAGTGPGGADVATIFISVPTFNTAGGTRTLTSIAVTLFGSIGATMSVNNIGAGAAEGFISGGGQIKLFNPASTSTVLTTAFPTQTENYSLGVGESVSFNPVVSTDTKNVTINSGSFAVWTSPTGAGSVLLPIIGNNTTGGNGTGSITTSNASAGYASATVTYTYSTVDTVVPEPRVYGAIGAVACLGLLGYRRLRARQAAQA